MTDIMHNALGFYCHAVLPSYKYYFKHLRSLIIYTRNFSYLLFILFTLKFVLCKDMIEQQMLTHQRCHFNVVSSNMRVFSS